MEVNSLYEKFAKLERLLKRRQIQSSNTEGQFHMDPMHGQGRVIAALSMKDGISTKELSYVMDIAPPTLNEMLAKLVKAGYVERKASEEDKRIILNYVTPAGREMNAQHVAEDDIPFLDCLSEAEQVNLSDYLDRIIARLEEALSERQGASQEGEEQEPNAPGGWGRPQKGRGPKPQKPGLFGRRGKRPPMPEPPEYSGPKGR